MRWFLVVQFKGDCRAVVPSSYVHKADVQDGEGFNMEAFWYADAQRYAAKLRAAKDPDLSKGEFLRCKQVVNESKYYY